MVTKRGHNSGQNNYNITCFFQGKVTFMVTLKKKTVFIFTTKVSVISKKQFPHKQKQPQKSVL